MVQYNSATTVYITAAKRWRLSLYIARARALVTLLCREQKKKLGHS